VLVRDTDDLLWRDFPFDNFEGAHSPVEQLDEPDRGFVIEEALERPSDL
jgi:hypothetical protein